MPDVTVLTVADRLYALWAMQTQLTLESGYTSFFIHGLPYMYKAVVSNTWSHVIIITPQSS